MIFRLLYAPIFFAWYFAELLMSNLVIAKDILTPPFLLKPGIVGVPVDDLTKNQLFWFANLMTMTPGTLSLEFSEDEKLLYIHVMYLDDPEVFRREAEKNFKPRLKKVFS